MRLTKLIAQIFTYSRGCFGVEFDNHEVDMITIAKTIF